MTSTQQMGAPRGRVSTLLLFSESFPYDVALEDTFLGPELPHLQRAFDRVILIPSRRGGQRCNLPAVVKVEEGLAALQERHANRLDRLVRALRTRLFWTDLLERPSLLWQPRGLARLVSSCARAALTRDWVVGFLEQTGMKARDCVAYTFWCDSATTGLSLVKQTTPELVLVSRAHGADLYLERHDPPFQPCRAFTLRQLDRLFPDSERGVRYMAERYPWFAARCEAARMGVADPAFQTDSSPPGRFSVVSCSLIVPVKRVDLILRAVEKAACERPDVQFEWHHFGTGPLRAQVEAEARQAREPNLTIRFPGYTSTQDLFEFYRTQPVDVFVNASLSEGTSVALMEAISCGIPAIATAVGGNPEIVSELNGSLVGADPSPDELAAALVELQDHPDAAAAKRRASRALWQRQYDAEANYASFAGELVGIRASR